MLSEDEIRDLFAYPKPLGSNQASRFEQLRTDARKLAFTINAHCPESREKSLAITTLQQAIIWANASIAIHEKGAVTDTPLPPSEAPAPNT